MLKTILAVLLAGLAVLAMAQESYDSLQDYCLKTGVDTPDNCRCGQATADAIMSDEEQAAALAMMAYEQRPQMTPEEQMALMEKLSQVTGGCAD